MTRTARLIAVAVVSTLALSPAVASAKKLRHTTVRAHLIKKQPRARAHSGATVLGALRDHAPHPRNPGALARAKANAERRFQNGTGQPSPLAAISGGLNLPGLANSDNLAGAMGTPSDSTGAVGPNNYVEFVNSVIGVYKKSDLTLDSGAGKLGEMDMAAFVGAPGKDVFDPQIQWDPVTQRWYYLIDYIDQDKSGSNPGVNALAFGWSKTADPNVPPSGFNSATGWCRYIVDTGAEFDDYPKLGSNNTHLIFGANVFADNATGGFQTARVFTVNKPGLSTAVGGSNCSTSLTLKSFGTAASNLLTSDGDQAFTPVPAVQTESSTNGWVVAADYAGSGSQSQLMVWHVDSNGDLHADTSSDGNVGVTSYSIPPNIPQPGTNRRIDSSDARITQAVVRTDPDVGAPAIWTQHTISGGAGAQVRWYEIVPSLCNRTSGTSCNAAARRQQGNLSNASLYYFNGAVSPAGAGNTAVVQYNSGSSAQVTDIRAQSRLSATALGTMTGEVNLGASSAIAQDFSCPSNGVGSVCRWGDYAAATPDPSASNVVWGSNQLIGTGGMTGGQAVWTTRNFALTP
ncbi:MAG TPA: hypothetical protein VF752_14505 [Thermoleophilaceae bacterium]